ncbi:MAG: hypothetical protein NZ912_08890 [Ignisphaera sp.]|nr:hypothetical protein [Ignisphaera sp.]
MRRRRCSPAEKGISGVVVTVLMIIIAISLVGIVWLFSSTLTQSLARTASIDIIEAKYLLGQSNIALVTVKNTGTLPVTISSITIPGVTCSFTAGATIQPGGVATFTATGCQALTAGSKITIIVSGTAQGTNEPVSAVGQIVVM